MDRSSFKLRIAEHAGRMAPTTRKLGLGPVNQLANRLFTRALGEVVVGYDSLSFAGSLRHRGYLDSLRRGQPPEARELGLFLAALRTGATAVDVGAYLGVYTCLAARQVGPEGGVIAFEPDPDMNSIRPNDGSSRTIRCEAVRLDDALEEMGASAKDLCRWLAGAGYRVARVTGREGDLAPVPPWPDALANLWCLPS